MKTKWMLFLVLLMGMPVKADDLTQFDFPLLLGEWYWFSPNQQGVQTDTGSYKAINISFNSDYRFEVKLLRTDGEVERATGDYDLDDNMLTLLDDSGVNQAHPYQLNHNQLMLQGAKFTKLLPQDISGSWQSNHLGGADISDDVSKLSLMLRPDFLFSMRVSGEEGKSVVHRGVYLLEDDHIVLIYKDGQQESQFELAADTLRLTDDVFGMEAILTRN